MNFDDIQAVACDMDGVLWRGTEPLAGMKPFFAFLQEHDVPFMLATNNSSRSPEMYVEKIRKMGVETVAPANIINSGLATAHFLQREYPTGADVHVMGGRGLFDVIAAAGFNIVATGAEVVVVGLDMEMTYAQMKQATFNIRAGGRFIATNDDATYPTPEGLAPGAGSLVAALKTSTGQEPTVVGKPHAAMFAYALDQLDMPPENTLMIGDRLSTDILGGHNAGMKTALVFSGVTQPDDLIESDIQPDVAYEDLDALVKAWTYEGGKRRR